MRTAIPPTVLAAALAGSLASAPAHARAGVFVASYGNDANPCTFGSPCNTFQQAVNVVDAGGEVTAIDSAGFGPISITKAVAITSPNGVAGIVPVSGGIGITINAGPNDAVHVQGLNIDGGGGTNIAFLSGNSLVIDNCVVRDFQSSGIGLAPTTSATIESQRHSWPTMAVTASMSSQRPGAETYAPHSTESRLITTGELGSVCTPIFFGECLWNCDRNDRNIQRNHRFLRCGRELPWGSGVGNFQLHCSAISGVLYH